MGFYFQVITGYIVVSRMAPHGGPCPNPLNLWICHSPWQRGTKVADGIEVNSQLTLKEKNYPGLSGGPNVSTTILKCGKGGKRGDPSDLVWERLECHCPWKWRKGPWAKECTQHLETRKLKEMESLLEAIDRTQPCWHLDFSSVRPILDF